MGRPRRLDIEHGIHHVMNRGASGQRVFFTEGDGRRFIDLLVESLAATAGEVHAYCLMPNHFHLLLRFPSGGLSETMQRLTSRYTRAVNLRRGRDGPLFRGRFRSMLVGTDGYLANVGRYIHRNPLDLADAGALASYRWSSYGAYVGCRSAPAWLHRQMLLDATGSPLRYRAFVEHDLEEPADVNELRWLIRVVLSETFAVECSDDNVARLERTVAVAIADRVTGPARRIVEAVMGDVGWRARREAVRRAERRVRSNPSLEPVIARTIHLARYEP